MYLLFVPRGYYVVDANCMMVTGRQESKLFLVKVTVKGASIILSCKEEGLPEIQVHQPNTVDEDEVIISR